MDEKRKRSLDIFDSLTPSNIDIDAPRTRRVRKPTVVYDPQTELAASSWRSEFQVDKTVNEGLEYQNKTKEQSKNKVTPPDIIVFDNNDGDDDYNIKHFNDGYVLGPAESRDEFSVITSSYSASNRKSMNKELRTKSDFSRYIKHKAHDLEIESSVNEEEGSTGTITAVVNIIEYEHILVSLDKTKTSLEELKAERSNLKKIHDDEIKTLRMTIEKLTHENKTLLQANKEGYDKIDTLKLDHYEVKKKIKELECLVKDMQQQEGEKNRLVYSNNLKNSSNLASTIPFHHHSNNYSNQKQPFPPQMPFLPYFYHINNNNYHRPPSMYQQNSSVATGTSLPQQSQMHSQQTPSFPMNNNNCLFSQVQAMLAKHQAAISELLKSNDSQSS